MFFSFSEIVVVLQTVGSPQHTCLCSFVFSLHLWLHLLRNTCDHILLKTSVIITSSQRLSFLLAWHCYSLTLSRSQTLSTVHAPERGGLAEDETISHYACDHIFIAFEGGMQWAYALHYIPSLKVKLWCKLEPPSSVKLAWHDLKLQQHRSTICSRNWTQIEYSSQCLWPHWTLATCGYISLGQWSPGVSSFSLCLWPHWILATWGLHLLGITFSVISWSPIFLTAPVRLLSTCTFLELHVLENTDT